MNSIAGGSPAFYLFAAALPFILLYCTEHVLYISRVYGGLNVFFVGVLLYALFGYHRLHAQ